MKDKFNDQHAQPEYSDADVVRLVADAGPRPGLTELEDARLRRAATDAWEAQVRRRRYRRWSAVCALAASVVAGIAIAWWIGVGEPGRMAERVAVASVSRTVGASAAAYRDGAPMTLGVGDALRAGDRIVIAEPGGLALTLENGMQLRIDGGSSVVAETTDRLLLESGRLYADSPASYFKDASVTIRTAQAVARDIGTQFQVVATAQQTRVLVREGRVEVDRDTQRMSVEPGQALAVYSDGLVERETVAPDAAEWQWTLSIAANPDVDGEPVIKLLEWVARETGKTLVFADGGLKSDAQRIRLRGTIGTLTPLQSLDAMLKATNLDYELTTGGAIVVKRRPR